MKVGGNESATKYFQSHGGTSALSSKDSKMKYTSAAAIKYKDELKKRASADAREYPEEVVVMDLVAATPTDGTSAAAEPGDDFFSSWEKPSIKRPSNPPSRTQTPPVISRTASPFLNPVSGTNGAPRSKSPLPGSESESTLAPSRAVPSAAIRKTTGTGGPRKTNVLGAKKTQKLGAKKLGGAEAVDFEAAEKKAKEEAERIEKLGYDPEAEEAEVQKTIRSASVSEKTKIAAPTPINPVKGYGAPKHERTKSEMERLGMGVGRLGFGQVGGSKPAASAPKKMGFGSVGVSRAVEEDDDEKYARQKFGAQKGISSDEFFGRKDFDPAAQTEAKQRLQGFEGATSISSNAYFGRAEEDIPQADEYGNYGDLEGAARDFVRKFGVTAGDDLENLTNVLGEGATKLQGAIRSYLNG